MSRPMKITHDGEQYVAAEKAARQLRVSLRRLYQYLQPTYTGSKLRSCKQGKTYVCLADVKAFAPKAVGNPKPALFKSSPAWKARDVATVRRRKRALNAALEIISEREFESIEAANKFNGSAE